MLVIIIQLPLTLGRRSFLSTLISLNAHFSQRSFLSTLISLNAHFSQSAALMYGVIDICLSSNCQMTHVG